MVLHERAVVLTTGTKCRVITSFHNTEFEGDLLDGLSKANELMDNEGFEIAGEWRTVPNTGIVTRTVGDFICICRGGATPRRLVA